MAGWASVLLLGISSVCCYRDHEEVIIFVIAVMRIVLYQAVAAELATLPTLFSSVPPMMPVRSGWSISMPTFIPKEVAMARHGKMTRRTDLRHWRKTWCYFL